MAFIENEPGAEILLGMTLERYRYTQTFAKLLEQMGEEADLLQDVNRELYDLLNPDALDGQSLDMLGRVVGATRGSLSDTPYRLRIKAALGESSSGTPEQIISAVRGYTGVTNPSGIEYIPEYPAIYWIVDWDSTGVPQRLLDVVSPAGVQGLSGDFLMLTTGELLQTTQGENILIVREDPEEGGAGYPADVVWDGGMGAVDPDTLVFTEAWPFRGTTGVGEYPDGGLGAIDPDLYTFTDGTYAEDQGG